MKRSTKYKEINVCLLERKVLRNSLIIFPKMVVVTKKNCWSVIKPFLTNKGHINGQEIILKCEDEAITESSVLTEMFSSHKFCRKNIWKKAN